MQKNEYFQIRRKHVLYLLIMLALLVGVFYLPRLVSKINVDTDIRIAMAGAMRRIMFEKPEEFETEYQKALAYLPQIEINQ